MWIPRNFETRVRHSARTRPVVVLTGARQTGKTAPNSYPLVDGFRALPVAELR